MTTTPSTTDLALRPLSGMIAAEVGAPLADLLADESCHDQLRTALVDHKVLVFRGADPTPEQHVALTRIFGEPVPPAGQNPRLPDNELVCVFDSDGGYKADKWHADETFQDQPASGAVLTIRIRPETGGDTTWANCEVAYDALSNGMKDLLDGRSALHEITPGHSAVHPVIRTHPVSGRKCIYVNDIFTRGIVNLPPDESDAILPFLKRHISRPEFTYRHIWGDGDIVAWDNRSTQHYALADFQGRRMVHRVGFVAEPFDG